MTNGVSAVTAGGATTYTIVVTNAGPGGVIGATVTDTAPANVTFGTWTCAASAGSTCPASGTGNITASVDLLAGGTATFTVPAMISIGGQRHRDEYGDGLAAVRRDRSDARQQQRG